MRICPRESGTDGRARIKIKNRAQRTSQTIRKKHTTRVTPGSHVADSEDTAAQLGGLVGM